MKTIAVIGHLVWDRIRQPSGDKVESLGGIAYSLAALASIAEGRYKVHPVCNIGVDLALEAKTVFGRLDAIDLGSMRIIGRRNKIHELVYSARGYREEHNIGEMPKIKPFLFDCLDNIDVALVNYIGGDEFPPRYLSELKKRFDSLIFLDYHSLALGRVVIDKSKRRVKRHYRYNPHWREYISAADIVQMNHTELQSIFPETENLTDSIVKSALKVKSIGPKIVIITREEKEIVVIAGPNKRSAIQILPVTPVKRLVDPTGCGDSFAAGFISNYINNMDVLKACKAGLELAGRKAGFSGLDGFRG